MSLYVLGVEQSTSNPAAVWHSDYHRHLDCSVGPVTCPGGLSDELVDGWPNEIGKLDFRYRAHAPKSRS